MIRQLQSDGVVDGQNCRQCNQSSTEKANNIGNIIDEGVVDAFVADEKANNIGPIRRQSVLLLVLGRLTVTVGSDL